MKLNHSRTRDSLTSRKLSRWTLCSTLMSLILPANLVALAQEGAKTNLQAQSVSQTSKPSLSWPAFLGSQASGINTERIPEKWTTQSNIAWKTALVGHGQSSPVAWENQIYVTTVDGPKKDTYHVVCLDRTTGKIQWDHSVPSTSPVANSYYVSRAAPTPVVDQDGIIAFFESGDCIALTHDGKIRWSRSVEKEFGPWQAEFGLGASPCQDAQRVFILLEHDGPGHLIALSKESGETLWSKPRAPGRSWASPAIFNVENTPQVVVSSNGSVKAYAPEDGQELWTVGDLGGNTTVSPIDAGNGTLLVGASAGRNGENSAQAQKSNGLMRIQKADSGWKTQWVWQADKLSPSWASPVQFGKHAYWVNRIGVLSCIDLETGSVLYNERLKQACWATPVGVGDRLYFFGKEGLTTVIAQGPTFQVIAENETIDPAEIPKETTPMAEEATEERRRSAAAFSGPTLYGAAVAGDMLVVRIGNQVIAVQNKQ